MEKLIEVVRSNGELWYFRSRSELKEILAGKDTRQCSEIPVFMNVVAKRTATSKEGYAILKGEIYPVIEIQKAAGNEYYIIPIQGHAVAWRKDNFDIVPNQM